MMGIVASEMAIELLSKIEAFTMTSQIRCFSIGDGALHFSYMGNNKIPSLAEVKEYLEKDQRAEMLRNDGWVPVVLDQEPILVIPIMRINKMILLVNGWKTVYRINSNKLWEIHNHCSNVFLKAMCYKNGKLVELKNRDFRGAIRHFINNEHLFNGEKSLNS